MNRITTTSILRTPPCPRLEEAQSYEEATINKVPKLEINAIEGKHIAKRDAAHWPDYGDPKIWDMEFESAVLEAKRLITAGSLKSDDLLGYFEKKSNNIAVKRKNKESARFGLRRDDFSQSSGSAYITPLNLSSPYGYALDRALKLSYDGEHYIEKQGTAGEFFSDCLFFFHRAFKYGLVQGKIKGQNIPLTQYVFAPHIKKGFAERFFGDEDKDYIFTDNGLKSAVWFHSDREVIPRCIEYINEMVKKGLNGDLSVIPKIHWWYVHLAPTWRGSGGIAEMLTNTLCRLRGVDLPPWKSGVAPSVEILLEPDEEKFCLNYHQLFEKDQKELEVLFKASN